MTVSTSRITSIRPPSVARSIQKRRDKPYKTEQSRIVAKRRKLTLNTSYAGEPEGFKFLPVGTPELAERCKELSRKRGLPVNVVNGKPASRHATDPDKVSHHIHRIGYHFRLEVLQDACQELGYVYHRGRFVKETSLAALNEQSKMARTMAKYGVHLDEPGQGQETTEQVRAAIKELFPRIPEDDLQAILKHAWEEGTGRVGNNSMLELPRRVQLATIARIRHTYTDYDRLLRAFEWSQARAEVEPVCLQKLIEWRGENEDEHDDELEEIVRETIVIDDDDDGPQRGRNGSEADDEDSADQGYASDISLEISHQPAAIEDLGAESHDERSSKFLQRHQQPYRNVEQRHLDVRQKIGIARQQLRNAPPPNVVRVHVPESPSNHDMVMIGGQMYRRAPPPSHYPPSPAHHNAAPPAANGSIYSLPPEHAFQNRSQAQSPRVPNSMQGRPLSDRPIASIEPQDDLRRVALASASAYHDGSSSGRHSRPESPVGPSPGKRRRVGSSPTARQPEAFTPVKRDQYSLGHPAGPVYSAYPDHQTRSLPTDRGSPFMDGPNTIQAVQNGGHHLTQPAQVRHGSISYRTDPQPGVPGPSAPSSCPQDQRVYESGGVRSSHGPMVDHQGAIAPVQYMPIPQHRTARSSLSNGQASAHAHAQPQPRVVYVEAPRGYAPQPLHGAPAAIQQLPREAPRPNNWPPVLHAPMTVSQPAPAPVPTYAPHSQFYYPR